MKSSGGCDVRAKSRKPVQRCLHAMCIDPKKILRFSLYFLHLPQTWTCERRSPRVDPMDIAAIPVGGG